MRQFLHAAILCFCCCVTRLPLAAQTDHTALFCDGAMASQAAQGLEDTGGRHLTASGTLRILLVFVSFADDDTEHPYWPAHSAPPNMRQFIDPDTTTKSDAAFNLTNYFSRMSLGRFHLIGDVVWVETQHPRSEYSNGSRVRANTAVLTEQVDSLVDFSQYDAWTNSGDYLNTQAPDSLVDMIVMVWRANIFASVGEASLGHGATLLLDGKKIGMGYPEYLPSPVGSGITCEYLYNDDPPTLMRTIVHELGHWFLGASHPYSSTSDTDMGHHHYWGMICDGRRVSSCINSYERERLGWIVVPELSADTTVQLADYVKTGSAFKYHPSNGEDDEWMYFENHQHLSAFDDVTANPEDKGLWIVHQQAGYMETDNLRIEDADGNWSWNSTSFSSACYSQALPVFRRGVPGVLNGASHRDQLRASSSGSIYWMYVLDDSLGNAQCGSFFTGEGFRGAFDTSLASVFSPYSNPSSSTWDKQATGFTLQVLRDSAGVLSLHRYSNPLDAAPARRCLGMDTSAASSATNCVCLAWGTHWSDGQPLEPDVVSSELQRMEGAEGQWVPAYEGAATSWCDTSADISSRLVSYRVRVRDTKNKYSCWSAVLTVVPGSADAVAASSACAGGISSPVVLDGNYPNPFNPTTVISGQWTVDSWVKLVVYDVLGREVATLANGRFPAGQHFFTFDGRTLAGGVYFYRLTAGSYSSTRKMILTR